jgi:two-component system NtrC family sensor kinase
MGYTELLVMDNDYNDEHSEKLKNILESIKRARSIVNDLLKFARKENVQKENININDVVRQTLALREYEHRVNNIQAECKLQKDIPTVLGNFVRLQQVILNILINAEHAINKEERGKIKVSTGFNKKSNNVFIEIADNGQKISPQIINKIFDPFFTTKEVGKGTGLGLSTSYGIIKDHEGEITVESNKNLTTFSIILPPASGDKDIDEDAISIEKDLKVQGEPILVVDDEPVIVRLLEDFFGRKGFTVKTAATGAQALEILKTESVELIITDIKMPKMDGRQFYDEIKSSKPELLERIIFITGDTLSTQTREFLKQIGGCYLKKPFSFEEIMRLIIRIKKKTIQKELF